MQPVCCTAWIAKLPQPVPISRMWSVGLMCALSMKQFAPLGVFERLGGGAGVGFGQPYRARVCHVWGEEGGEHVVADVVVGVDVELSLSDAVASSSYSCEAVAHGGSECGAIG